MFRAVLKLIKYLVLILLIPLSIEIWLRVQDTYRLRNAQEIKDSSLRATADYKRIIGKSLSDYLRRSLSKGVEYELRPYIVGDFLGQSIKINKYGMRDSETQLKRESKCFRVMGLGDAVMFGWGVSESESYPSLVERQLSSSLGCVDFLNFGTPGFNTSQEVSLYRTKGQYFNPDLLILHFRDDDIGLPMYVSTQILPFSLSKSYALEALCGKLGNNIKSLFEWCESSRKVELVDTLPPEKISLVKKRYYSKTGIEGVQESLVDLAELSKKKNTKILVVFSGASNANKTRVISTAQNLGMHTLDIKPYVEKYIKQINIPNNHEARRRVLCLSSKDCHPSRDGHKIYAEAIKEYILSHHLLNN